MKLFIMALAFVGLADAASAQDYGTGSNPENHYVNGYERGNGTYVPPHYQTNPNGSTYDNYETRGNYDPYTGTTGGRRPN
jgi:hypothetical protein